VEKFSLFLFFFFFFFFLFLSLSPLLLPSSAMETPAEISLSEWIVMKQCVASLVTNLDKLTKENVALHARVLQLEEKVDANTPEEVSSPAFPNPTIAYGLWH